MKKPSSCYELNTVQSVILLESVPRRQFYSFLADRKHGSYCYSEKNVLWFSLRKKNYSLIYYHFARSPLGSRYERNSFGLSKATHLDHTSRSSFCSSEPCSLVASRIHCLTPILDSADRYLHICQYLLTWIQQIFQVINTFKNIAESLTITQPFICIIQGDDRKVFQLESPFHTGINPSKI